MFSKIFDSNEYQLSFMNNSVPVLHAFSVLMIFNTYFVLCKKTSRASHYSILKGKEYEN